MAVTNEYISLVSAIVDAQVAIIGPIATEISRKINGINNPDKRALEMLVKQYETLFGQASVETCKEAIKKFNLNQSQSIDLPDILK